jgi:hypothetical protein
MYGGYQWFAEGRNRAISFSSIFAQLPMSLVEVKFPSISESLLMAGAGMATRQKAQQLANVFEVETL